VSPLAVRCCPDIGDVPHDENEQVARNAEPKGEDEGNAEQALVGALLASQVRCGRGLNKLPSGRFVITTVNEGGDLTQPPVSVNAWKTLVGKLIRENVPVTYRFWKAKSMRRNTLFWTASNKIYGIPWWQNLSYLETATRVWWKAEP
jgi:hypothetical protein